MCCYASFMYRNSTLFTWRKIECNVIDALKHIYLPHTHIDIYICITSVKTILWSTCMDVVCFICVYIFNTCLCTNKNQLWRSTTGHGCHSFFKGPQPCPKIICVLFYVANPTTCCWCLHMCSAVEEWPRPTRSGWNTHNSKK